MPRHVARVGMGGGLTGSFSMRMDVGAGSIFFSLARRSIFVVPG